MTSFSNLTLIFSVNFYISTPFHNILLFKAAYTIDPLVPFLITGKIYRKSPHNNIGKPPINFLLLNKSYNELFTASKALLSIIEASSIIIECDIFSFLPILSYT